MRRSRILGALGAILVLLAVAFAIRGSSLGTAILLLLAALALSSAWALWPSRP